VRVVFLGAGAIGAGMGALVAAAGHDVLLVARGAHGAAMARDGVDLRLPSGPRRVRVPVGTVDDLRADDLVVVCTMGHDTRSAVAGLAPDRVVVSFQNGLAPLEALAPRPVVAGMVFVPAERRAPGVVALAGTPAPGAVVLGRWPTGRVGVEDALAAALSAAGFRVETTDDVAPWIRAKTLTNLGGTLIALCDDPPRAVLDAAVDEARACFRAAGVAVMPDDEFDARIGPMAVAAVDGLPRVGGSTRHALARGDRLETASLHGWFVREGERLGVPTPWNRAIVALAAEAERERWRPGSLSPVALEARLRAVAPAGASTGR
jgi:2-dehydropantoate 2-reductase